MPPARKSHPLSSEDFDRLLDWLDPERDCAGEIYERIRWRLIAILASRGCLIPEELADETIDRVARRVGEIASTFVGEKAVYFLGVANNVHHEYLKRPAITPPLEPGEDVETKERTHNCLDKCLAKLSTSSRTMIERYYAADKQAKIDLRRRIAEELGVSLNTLRLRALRIREKLQECIETCLQT